MCLIIAKPKNISIPKYSHLYNANLYNKDGIGIMYHKYNNNHIVIKKDFTGVDQLYNFLCLKVNKQDTLVIHFRMATSGLVDSSNRHPFPITLNKTLLRQVYLKCKYGLAHNGDISQYSNHNKYSDTQKFILDIMANTHIKYNLNNSIIQKLILSYIGNDKLSILDYKGNLILLGDYIKENGLYYSNSSYKLIKINYKESYVSYCDYCDKKTKLTCIDIELYKYYLCKKCIKIYKKNEKKFTNNLDLIFNYRSNY